MEIQVSESGTAALPTSGCSPGTLYSVRNGTAACSKRSKPKAPAPPTLSKHVESSSIAENLEGENKNMEQKDNVLNTHFDLTVVLPGGVEQSTNINGSKPVMDLLVFLCGKYHMNPSSHTIELVGREKNQIQFKPNTLIGTLEVEKVILKQKIVEEKKKPTSVVPEQTVRVVINYKRTQKTIVRVSPLVPLQELIPIISNKCEFDPKSTILVKDFECQEPYDLTKSLKELGLREVYAVDTSVGCSQGNFQGGSIQQGQSQIPANITLEKENKGFFNMFRLSKKKREKPASAPATPLISQQRPLGMSSSSAYCPTYESNTLPSDLPKKRRAPAPPLSVSQSFPKDLTQQASIRPTSCFFPDDSVNGTEQNVTGSGRQRAESLPFGDVATSSNVSSRKTKRKAPLPPSKSLDDQTSQDNTTDSNLGSVVPCPSPDAADKASIIKMSSTSADDQAGIGSEHNLEEIVETEEVKSLDIDEAEDAILQKGEETLCLQVSIDFPSNSENAQTSGPGNLDVHNSSIATDKQTDTKSEDKVSTAEDVCNQIATEKDEKLMANMNKDLSVANTYVEQPPIAENTTSEVHQRDSDGMSSFSSTYAPDKGTAEKLPQAPEMASISGGTRPNLVPKDSASFQSSNITVKDQQKHSDKMEINEMKVEETNSVEADKTLDFQNARCTKATNGNIIPSDDTTLKNTSESIQHTQINNFSLPVSSEQQNCVSAATKSADTTEQGLAGKQGIMSVNQPAPETLTFADSHGPLLTKDAIRSPESPTKIPIIYKCESEPKPKPSNEITRDYIPKIGMTTYKIVPSKSLENEAFVTSGIMPEAEPVDQQTSTFDDIPDSDTSKKSIKRSNTTEEPPSSVRREPVAFHQEADFDKTVKWMPINSTTQSHHPEATVPKLFADSEVAQPKVMVTRRTQSTTERKMKPGSVFLQLHKRSSGQYVTSALARSPSLPSQSSLDRENTFLTKEENGVPFQEVSPRNVDGLDVIIPPPPEFAGISEGNAQKELSKPGETSSSRPSKPPKVPSKPSVRVKLSDTKALRTTVAATTYTSTSPSPFALAVSSAVKKTHTNATCSFKPKCAGTDSSTLPSPTNYADRKLPLPSSIPNESNYSNILKQTLSPERETKKDFYNETAGTQTQHIQPQLPSPSRKSKPTLISQISDPRESHQAVLDAIHSGEGAAKLKKVDTLPTM
ncbi:cordon-bleu protein-like 1b isoform X2 [Heterodontus francisci]|uniref:cordon-bleu protein-like 1b isoform X2 n=1 Tax=Heterodontus francisci TaxID=7792 RepID=UPI00355C670C